MRSSLSKQGLIRHAGRFMDVELQQRAVEYMSLERKPDLARSNVVAMPPWEKRKSLLLRRMAEREVPVLSRPVLSC